jgi:hypothetical protein
MSNFTYLSTEADLVQDAASITATSNNASFPDSNLRYDKSVPLANVWKSAALATGPTILFDFGASHNWNVVILLNHNLTSAATVTVTAGTTNATADFSQSMTWREFDMYYRNGATLTYRYMRLFFSDAANPDTYISVGKVLVGLTTTLTHNYRYGATVDYQAGQRVSDTDLMTTSVDRLADIVQLQLTWSTLTTTVRDEMIAFLKALKGAAIPLFIILDTTVYEGYYVRLRSGTTDIRNFRPDIGGVVFREESRGKKLA